MNGRTLSVYVAAALFISWLLQAVAMALWGVDGYRTRMTFVFVMWTPTVLALTVLWIAPEAREGVRWRLGRVALLPLGIAVEAAIAFLVLAAFVGSGLASAGWFRFTGSGVEVTGGPWLLGGGLQTWTFYILNIVATVLAFSIVGLVATTGEEFAWRGFLQGHLETRFGSRRGIFILAAIWWAWHLPGLLAGYNFPQSPYLGALVLFPLQMIGTSLFFGWLTIRSGSFWSAALAHAAVNSVQQGIIDNLQLKTPMLTVDVVRTILILAVGMLCWSYLRQDRAADVSN